MPPRHDRCKDQLDGCAANARWAFRSSALRAGIELAEKVLGRARGVGDGRSRCAEALGVIFLVLNFFLRGPNSSATLVR